MNVECQPHLSISWNFLSLLSLLIFSISFERTELTSQQQKLGPHPTPTEESSSESIPPQPITSHTCTM